MKHYHRDKTGELVESNILVDIKTGLNYRENTSDKNMIKDCMKNYTALNIGPDDRVLDLGANIGAFSFYASEFVPWNQILAVEADEYNCKMIHSNFPLLKYIQAAVVPDDYVGDHIEFLINKRSGRSACSGKALLNDVKKTKSHVSVVCRAIRFSEIVKKFQPTILKIDIEGGEYGIIDRHIPECIKQIGGELHKGDKMFEVMDNLRKEWDIVHEEIEYVFKKPSMINFVIRR